MAEPPLPMLDLFAGIGGFSFALGRRCETVAYCESNENCRRVLAANMQKGLLAEAPIEPDVCSLRMADLPRKPAVICAGFPCQDISQLTPSPLGLEGARTGLVSHVFRLLDEDGDRHVQHVFLENSPMILNRGLDRVIAQLTSRGFRLAYGIFAASEAGAPHSRRRWFCLASRAGSSPFEHATGTAPIAADLPDWAPDIEPARVVPRTADSRRAMRTRGRLLGNSVVPRCVVLAADMLNDALSTSADDRRRRSGGDGTTKIVRLRSRDVAVVDGSDVVTVPRPVGPTTAHPRVLSFRGVLGKPAYTWASWPTPTAAWWDSSNTDSRRSRHLLANQVCREAATIEYVRQLTGAADPLEQLALVEGWCLSPAWVEWLMGYPPGWTLLPASV